MDDTFLLFKNRSHILPFFEYLNSQHHNIKFTIEHENSGKLAFLDVLVHKENSNFTTDLYRKPTHTGLGMKYDSAVSYNYKVNLIGCLFDRAFKICSSYHSLHIEMEKLKKYFTQNGFPIKLVENQIRLKLNNVHTPKPKVHLANKKTIYASIPYISDFNNKQISAEVRKLVSRFYPQLDVKLIFNN